MEQVDLTSIREKMTPADLARAETLAKRYNIAADAALLAVWSEGQQKPADMNQWIRAQAGYWTAAVAQAAGDAPRKLPNANAGNGAKQPGVGTPKQGMNKAIRDAWLGNGPKSWRG